MIRWRSVFFLAVLAVLFLIAARDSVADDVAAADQHVGDARRGGGEDQGVWEGRIGTLCALPSPGMLKAH